MAKSPARKAPATEQARPNVLIPTARPVVRQKAIPQPVEVQEIIVDQRPKVDPRTGKVEVPGQPSSKARHQTPDNETLRVRATRQVYYEHKRRREGDVFTLAKVEDFNAKCHVWVNDDTPERQTRIRETLNARHQQVLAHRAGLADAPAALADEDVLS